MPRQRLTSVQVKAYMAHWRAARAAELRELRAVSPEHKLRQVAALMASAKALGWSPAVAVETSPARERWRQLRLAYDGRV